MTDKQIELTNTFDIILEPIIKDAIENKGFTIENIIYCCLSSAKKNALKIELKKNLSSR